MNAEQAIVSSFRTADKILKFVRSLYEYQKTNEKCRFPLENTRSLRKHADLGSGGSGAIMTGNFNERVAQKLRKIILPHFGQ